MLPSPGGPLSLRSQARGGRGGAHHSGPVCPRVRGAAGRARYQGPQEREGEGGGNEEVFLAGVAQSDVWNTAIFFYFCKVLHVPLLYLHFLVTCSAGEVCGWAVHHHGRGVHCTDWEGYPGKQQLFLSICKRLHTWQ